MIIKRKLLRYAAILFLLVLSYSAHAQLYIGLEAGGNQNYLITNVSNLISTEYVPKMGFNISVPVQYKINDWFSLNADPGFIQKNYRMQRTDFYEGVYQDTKSNYWQLPVSAQFSFGGKKLKGFLDLGAYAAYWGSSHIEGAMPSPFNDLPYGAVIPYSSLTIFDYVTPYNYNEKYQFDKTRDNRVEFGVLAGVGFSYEPCKKCKLFTEFKYYDGLTDLQKNYEEGQVPRYNETGSITVGFLYKPNLSCLKKKHSKQKHSTTDTNEKL